MRFFVMPGICSALPYIVSGGILSKAFADKVFELLLSFAPLHAAKEQGGSDLATKWCKAGNSE